MQGDTQHILSNMEALPGWLSLKAKDDLSLPRPSPRSPGSLSSDVVTQEFTSPMKFSGDLCGTLTHVFIVHLPIGCKQDTGLDLRHRFMDKIQFLATRSLQFNQGSPHK